jgi:hypothetical protein
VGLWCPSAGIQGQKLVDFANRNYGTLTNGATYVPGRNGLAMNFDGTDDYITAPNTAPLNPARLTVCAWVKLLAKGVTRSGPIITKGTLQGDSTSCYCLYYNTFSDRFRFFVVGPAGAYTLSIVSANALGSPTIGVWYHVAGVFDGSTVAIYTNGKFDTSASASAGLRTDSTAAVTLGGEPSIATFFNNQAQDDHRIYNRALSASEIMQSYMGASPLVLLSRPYFNSPTAPPPAGNTTNFFRFFR